MSIKKTILSIVLLSATVLAFSFYPQSVKAKTVEELEAQIAVLLQRIKALQQQLALLQGQTTEWCYDFNRDLKYGNAGTEVRALQTALQKEGFYTKEITGQFDEYTASAVVGFQEKYKEEVLTPWRLEHGTGYVGSTTRAKLNKIYGCAIVKPCQNLWWYDNEHQYCQQKQFCGAYMYLGLHTFSTKEECEASLGKPSITVLSPKGGEKWEVGKTYTIQWSAHGIDKVFIRAVSLITSPYGDLLTPNGIAANLGSYSWTISTSLRPRNDYKISIAGEVGGEIISDESDNDFSIVATGTSTTPMPPSIPPSACTDSDGGKNLYVKGTTTGRRFVDDDTIITKEDFCVALQGSAAALNSCSGSNCGVYEFYCATVNNQTFVNGTISACSNGCNNGACVSVTTKADQEEKLSQLSLILASIRTAVESLLKSLQELAPQK